MERSDDVFTKDGTTDMNKAPANKEKTGTWKACPFIIGEEVCERLAYFGMSSNLVNYLHQSLNLNNAAASKVVTNFQGTCYLTPLLGAFLADAYLGRYWTIAIFSILYIMGMALLTMSASIVGIKPSCQNGICHPTAPEKTSFFIAIYLIALGTGGIKPCVSSFGADQFDDNDEIEKRRKSSFFNWFYLSINIGALIASSVLVWIQMNVGWGWGFGIPAVAMAIALVFFFAGTRLYRLQPPGGSPLTRILQVLVASMRKWFVKPPADKTLLYETANEESSIKGSRKLAHTHKFSFLDKSAVVTASDKVNGSVNPWRLCTATQVEEVKCIISLLPVWACCIVFTTVYSQMNTTFVLQGNTMDRHMGAHFRIPSASLAVFETLSVILWVLIYDQFIIPLARKFTGHARGFTQLQRMGIGLLISTLSMIAAAIVEVGRLNYIKRKGYYDLKTIPMSIFWQVPQYVLIGCAGVFTLIGQLEFFYDQAPDAMRSLCSALSLMAIALGSYLSTLIVTIVTRNKKLGWITENLNRGHLDYFFWLLVILSFINFMVFLLVSRLYVYKKAWAVYPEARHAKDIGAMRGMMHRLGTEAAKLNSNPRRSNEGLIYYYKYPLFHVLGGIVHLGFEYCSLGV
ncbi:Peptide transporter ptr1 [Datura stramonium]|uniref:Peptide transporter ptr1 n=1 Tax=Datura stramonium TaxID=4076 RepID=A0ABS8RH34_DATST|nr:Peptide transporter ptr1 [Datura stramonium]